MEVIVGKLAGFCGGVTNSVKRTDEILNGKDKVYCLGELVHNKQVVDKLEAKGLVVVEDINDVEDNSEVIVRAHGVPKETYRVAADKKLIIHDLTCPNVLRIHEKAEKYVMDDYFIILIAQKDHPEAIGTISFCGDDSLILESEEQIEGIINLLNNNSKKIAIISQTTFSVAKFLKYVDILKNRITDREILVDNTICSATDLRQKETSNISKAVDSMIIIGGKNSSNTKKLYEVASSNCNNTYIIETVHDINDSMNIIGKIGVMAGASTPKDSIDAVVNYLLNIKNY